MRTPIKNTSDALFGTNLFINERDVSLSISLTHNYYRPGPGLPYYLSWPSPTYSSSTMNDTDSHCPSASGSVGRFFRRVSASKVTLFSIMLKRDSAYWNADLVSNSMADSVNVHTAIDLCPSAFPAHEIRE